MPRTKKRSGRRTKTRSRGRTTTKLSPRTTKQISNLPQHAQRIYKKAHANALKQYSSPEKRRGGKRQSREQVAHKVAWSAVKNEYKKEGNEWVKKV
jgi:cation transport regulator